MKPIITKEEDISQLQTIYTLKVPRFYIINERFYKFKIVWWLIKMLWTRSEG